MASEINDYKTNALGRNIMNIPDDGCTKAEAVAKSARRAKIVFIMVKIYLI
jgi:hypothetical protein